MLILARVNHNDRILSHKTWLRVASDSCTRERVNSADGDCWAGGECVSLPETIDGADDRRGRVMMNDGSGLERHVFSYFMAFGAGDLESILAHYAHDAVYLPAGDATLTGLDAIRAAYVETLRRIRIVPGGETSAEDVLQFGDFAWVRTNSRASVLNLETGETSLGRFREVFLLRRVAENWKIWRYTFNTISGPSESALASERGAS